MDRGKGRVGEKGNGGGGERGLYYNMYHLQYFHNKELA